VCRPDRGHWGLQGLEGRHLTWMRAYEARPNSRSLASKADAIV